MQQTNRRLLTVMVLYYGYEAMAVIRHMLVYFSAEKIIFALLHNVFWIQKAKLYRLFSRPATN